jgi:hypothetical protein
MNKPIQFISIDKDGTCALNPEAEKIISNIQENVGIICVAGLYRTGKSYLLNRILNRQDGFEVGPTTNSCTKGLWMWGEPISFNNMKVLIIDTEGLGSAFEDRNETIDMEIFCLGVLLSSLFIYNSMKNIDESAVESLALVINFAKKIQSKFSNNGLNEYSTNFPTFLWVLRDFALDLIDIKGRKISASQYLENALTENENINDDLEVSKKNEIRKLLKLFFKERDCYTLIRPVSDEKKLRNIDKIPKSELREDFLKQMEDLVSRIFLMTRPKLIQGSFINGKMYIDLVKMYINSLNNNSLPDVKSSWKIVVDQQMENVFKKSIDYYTDEMLNLDFKKINTSKELFKKHNEIRGIAMDYLRDFGSLNVPLEVYLDLISKLDSKITDQYTDFISKWEEISSKNCKHISEGLIQEYKSNNKEIIDDAFSCLEMFEEVVKFIEEQVPNEMRYEHIFPQVYAFFTSQIKICLKENKAKTDTQIAQLKHENSVLQSAVEKNKEIIERTKEDYEMEINAIKENNQQMRLDLEAKVDEKTKMLKNAQYSNESIVDELKAKINMLNTLSESKKAEQAAQKEDKKKKKKETQIDEGLLDVKMDNILEKLDSYRDVILRNELEKAKLQLKLEMSNKIEDLENDFARKIVQAKKMCEKTVILLRNSFHEENGNLKQLIKVFNIYFKIIIGTL